MKKIITLFIVLMCFAVSCKSKIPYSENMKLEMKEMYSKDQILQIWDPKKEQRQSYRDSMEVELNLLCVKNLNVVKTYFNDNGFPGIKENGKEASLNFWLIVQHGDHDVKFQNKVLKAMRKEVNYKNVSLRNFAYLYDRVKKNKNKPQLYGTQISWTTGKPLPYNLKNPKEVNGRRMKMELEPIEDYLKSFNR
jgi:hypothetical protein